MAKDRRGNADAFVEIAARLGLVGLEIGLARDGAGKQTDPQGNGDLSEELKRNCTQAVAACTGKGSTLNAVGKLLEACVVNEILGAK